MRQFIADNRRFALPHLFPSSMSAISDFATVMKDSSNKNVTFDRHAPFWYLYNTPCHCSEVFLSFQLSSDLCHLLCLTHVCCYIAHPSETPLKIKSRDNKFVNNVLLYSKVYLSRCICTEIGTAVICVNYRHDTTIGTDDMEVWDFARLDFKLSFERVLWSFFISEEHVNWSVDYKTNYFRYVFFNIDFRS